MNKLITICITSMLAMLAACTEEQQPQPQAIQYAQPPAGAASVPPAYQPQVIYQQAPQQEDHTIRDGLIGGGIGYMLGRSSSGGGVQSAPVSHTVVNRTIVNKTVVVQRPPTPSYNNYRPTPSIRPSYTPTRSSFSTSSTRRR